MENALKILAIDTAMNGCCVGVRAGTVAGAYVCEPMKRGQAEALVPLVLDMVGQAKLDFENIDLIVTTIGPGAFTGLRIGLSAAQSFGLVLDVPVIGVTTLEVLAAQYLAEHSIQNDQKLAVLIETKRADFYFQLFCSAGGAVSAPQAISASEVVKQTKGGRVIFVGDALTRFCEESDVSSSDFTFHEILLPDPNIMVALGQQRYEDANQGACFDVSPLYLRPADVSKPKVMPRTLASK